jgi:osmotically-inducible protein OsmY
MTRSSFLGYAALAFLGYAALECPGCVASLLTGQKVFAAATEKVTDDQLFDLVRMRLISDTTVQGGNIEVEVQNGVVTLKGRVRTEKAKDKATKVVKKIKGVKSVDNQLKVDNTTP